MSKMQREKGKRWEQQVAAMLRDVFPGQEVRRGQQGDGAVRPDVVCPLVWVEAKVGSGWTYEGALKQACDDAAAAGDYGRSRWPVVLARRNQARAGQPAPRAVAVMKLEDFIDLLEVLWVEVRTRGNAEVARDST